MAKSLTIFIFALMFIANISAQSLKANSTVVVDEFVFGDPKLGISELVTAYYRIEAEFSAEIKAFNSINLEIKKLDKELAVRTSSIGGCVGSIDELLKKRENLLQEQKQITEDGRRRYDKRSLELISPILEKVDSALKEFEKVKGYNVVKRSSLPQYICSDPDFDKTAEFIEFYNEHGLIR